MTGARTNASEWVRRDGISFHSSHNEHTLTHTDRRGILCHKCRPRHPLPYKGRHCNKHLQFSRSHAILQDFSPSKSRNITTRNYPQPYRSINKQRYKKKIPIQSRRFREKKEQIEYIFRELHSHMYGDLHEGCHWSAIKRTKGQEAGGFVWREGIQSECNNVITTESLFPGTRNIMGGRWVIIIIKKKKSKNMPTRWIRLSTATVFFKAPLNPVFSS